MRWCIGIWATTNRVHRGLIKFIFLLRVYTWLYHFVHQNDEHFVMNELHILVCNIFKTWLIELSIFNFWKYFVWLRITDEGSVPEMHIWSILLIYIRFNPILNGDLRRSLFLYFNYLVSVTAVGPVNPRGHM